MNALMEANKTEQKIDYIPTSDMRRFVKALAMEGVDFRPYRAEKVTGIDRGKFYRALEDPKFRVWLLIQREKYQTACGFLVDNALLNNIRAGDTTAIRTFYELEGRISKGQKNGNGNGGPATVVEVNVYLGDAPKECIDIKPVDKVATPLETKDSGEISVT